jgi:SAM-dependent methyltransferase
MKWFCENYCLDDNEPKTVFDVGSCCIDDHLSYREIFNDDRFTYVGLDMIEGTNVTIAVKSPYKWNEVDDNYCDILISGQAFEHIEFPWLAITEIARIVKPGGVICIIAPNGLGFHRHPVDCWRYYSDGMIALARWAGLEILHVSTDLAPKGASQDWYGYWQDCMLIARKPETDIKKLDIINYKCEPADLEKMATGFVSIDKQDWYKKYKIKNYFKKIFSPVMYIKGKFLTSIHFPPQEK